MTASTASIEADSVSGLPGAGPVTAARLATRGLATVGDLLGFLPRAYEDYRRVYSLIDLATLPDGSSVLVKATVRRVHVFPRRLMDVHLEQGGARLRARWFHPPPGMSRAFIKGTEVALAGSLRRNDDGIPELVHPTVVTGRLGAEGGLGIRPRYPKVEGVPGRTMQKLIAGAVAALDGPSGESVEWLPAEVRRRLDLPTFADSVRALHLPPSSIDEADLAALREGRSRSHRRLAFEELFVVQLGLRMMRQRARGRPGVVCTADAAAVLRGVRAAFPYALTAAQEKAVAAVFCDMAAPVPMQRLVQGEVGSGKTAIAFAAALLAARSGAQALLMAPTEILAEQHARGLTALGEPLGLRVGLLTGGLPRAQQKAVTRAVAAGEVDLLVGTHALLEGRVHPPALALAIIDEQQRFGVRQRARLGRSGEEARSPGGVNTGILPHLLVLSATPIPRTLALTMYGDLDLSTLDELPPGRQPVRTRVCAGPTERDSAYAAIREAVARGQQAFVVCPVVHAGEASRGARPVSVNAHVAALKRASALGTARVGVVHGQLAGASQERVLRSFRSGELDVLVATTVIEVGIDVPRASVMVVEDAERFGLAQLHQLRGRVGRGAFPGTCWLCTGSETPAALERLRIIESTTDGFRIAEEDLRQRGPGELFGARQSGAPPFRFSDLAGYTALIEPARAEADRLLAEDPQLAAPAHASLRGAVERRWARGFVFAEEAG